MRNAVIGLDDERRAEDFRLRVHGTDLILEKWHGSPLHQGDRELRVEVECPESTAVSECCVEFGSVDRILYNLLNNASRHAATDLIRLVILRVPDSEGESLRFVLLNEVSEQELGYLRTVSLPSLFLQGISTTGSGCGLAIASEFVSHAYGLGQPDQAVEEGYLGAALLEGSFAVWFHWPRVIELPPA